MTALRSLPRPAAQKPPAIRPAMRRKRRGRMRGPKHDLWVVPYADMVTLLFAMFVVLYALGEVKISKMTELRKSMAFAFHYDGETSGDGEGGVFARGSQGGDLIDGAGLINAQWGPMERFLDEALAERFEKVTGKSLEVVVTDNTMVVSTSLDAFYRGDELSPRDEVQTWLVELFEGIWDYAAELRVSIDAPDVAIGRDASGRRTRADELCARRLDRMRGILRLIPAVDPRRVVTELRIAPPTDDQWQRAATISFAFSTP